MPSPLRRYARLFHEVRFRVTLYLILAVVQLGLAAPLPFVVQAIFDRAIGEERTVLLLGLTGVLLTLQLLSTAVGILAANGLQEVSADVVRRLRQAVFDRLYEVSIGHLERQPMGEIHDRVVHETERVDAMTSSGFALAAPATVMTVGILGVLAFINWLLFAISVVFVPVAYLVNRATRGALRRAAVRRHASLESLSTTAFNSLRTMRQTRILGVERFARADQDDVLGNAASASRSYGATHHLHLGVNRVLLACWAMAILAVGGVGVIDGQLTLGELFSFYAGLALIRPPLDALLRSVPFIIAGLEAFGRVAALLDVDDLGPYTGDRQVDTSGELAVRHVRFEYGAGDPVLVDVSLDIKPGEIAALVGPNGSGKTTLADLLLGFYEPSEGLVSADGIHYHQLDIRHLRRQFGVVAQDPTIIPGTILENITFGRPATEAELSDAVRLAGAGPLVAELEAGLDTRAYESGPLLSAGQLQRVALARALLGRPKVLILDEPSTHLDVAGLADLLQGLRSMPDMPAMLLITHEEKVAALADVVYHLDGGHMTRIARRTSGATSA